MDGKNEKVGKNEKDGKDEKDKRMSMTNIARSRKAALRNLISFCHNLSFVTI